MKKNIGLWLDPTSDPARPRWVVSLDDDGNSDTLASYNGDSYADALAYAKDESQRTGLPVVQVDKYGNRETVYEIGAPIGE